MARSAAEKTIRDYCPKCEHELDANGNCPKHWPPEYERLTQYRRQTVVNRVAQKTSPAEDLLALLNSPIGKTIDQLLDALAALTITTSAGKAKTLSEVRSPSTETRLPSFVASWADTVLDHADNRLWELLEEVNAFLNRPNDPKTASLCDTCGRKRIGEASYCHYCGTRILEGARRCRLVGCPNNNGRRANCPRDVPHTDG